MIGWSMAELDGLYWDEFLEEFKAAHEMWEIKRPR
jgi:hypothetical protein